ncbi:hypothetical protein T05_6399 [Trichinella murrelli]|uniref:Uncharacterized protein n=1 Tax=Trichinella murrelli TaxID=144512 RepID=A0A0V0UHJ1_9BILA|nr:hypothetical protein T05_6399 [Trichinella murrelli]
MNILVSNRARLTLQAKIASVEKSFSLFSLFCIVALTSFFFRCLIFFLLVSSASFFSFSRAAFYDSLVPPLALPLKKKDAGVAHLSVSWISLQYTVPHLTIECQTI